MQILRIEGMPPTQNEFRRMHHFEIAKRKKEWEAAVMIEVKRQSIEKVDKVIIVLDSIGNLASKKEVEDSIEGKSVADMSRAKQMKSLRIVPNRNQSKSCTGSVGTLNPRPKVRTLLTQVLIY